MPVLIMTKGLPGSGKTTWAVEQVKKNSWKRVNKDDLRGMIDWGRHSKYNEKSILQVRDMMVTHYLSNGDNVIVDDTNLASKHETRLRQLAKESGAEFRIQDFTDVTVEECLKRNELRPDFVPPKVIREMYEQFLKPEIPTYQPDPSLPKAVIVDIDGTLAHMVDRGPYDATKYHTDVVDTIIRDLVNLLDDYVTIIVVSGRDTTYRDVTEGWLKDNDVAYKAIFMRPVDDKRSDSIVKREIFEDNIRDNYNVLFVLDDRNRVVDMWRNELGVKVLQVAEGDF